MPRKPLLSGPNIRLHTISLTGLVLMIVLSVYAGQSMKKRVFKTSLDASHSKPIVRLPSASNF